MGIRVHPAQEDLPHQPEDLHQTEEVHQEVQEEAHLEAQEVDLQGVQEEAHLGEQEEAHPEVQEEAHLEVQEDHLTQEAVQVLQDLKQDTEHLAVDLVQVDLKVDPSEEAGRETMKVAKDHSEVQMIMIMMVLGLVLILLLLIQDTEHLAVVGKDFQEQEASLLLVNTLEMPVNLT